MLFILCSIVIIPMQVNQLVYILSLSSNFRKPFVPKPGRPHVMLCGHIADHRRLERFLREVRKAAVSLVVFFPRID